MCIVNCIVDYLIGILVCLVAKMGQLIILIMLEGKKVSELERKN